MRDILHRCLPGVVIVSGGLDVGLLISVSRFGSSERRVQNVLYCLIRGAKYEGHLITATTLCGLRDLLEPEPRNICRPTRSRATIVLYQPSYITFCPILS